MAHARSGKTVTEQMAYRGLPLRGQSPLSSVTDVDLAKRVLRQSCVTMAAQQSVALGGEADIDLRRSLNWICEYTFSDLLQKSHFLASCFNEHPQAP
jgi:hypothetical protein